ncbi:MAG: hypothetical protein IJ045_00065 [Ruminiclostridium sp.]|nr:hypothetical protein [Ruminiclostridium sp.]
MKVIRAIMVTLGELFAGDDSERITGSNKRIAVIQTGVAIFTIIFCLCLIALWIVGLHISKFLIIRIILGLIGFIAIALIMRMINMLSRSVRKK